MFIQEPIRECPSDEEHQLHYTARKGREGCLIGIYYNKVQALHYCANAENFLFDSAGNK